MAGWGSAESCYNAHMVIETGRLMVRAAMAADAAFYAALWNDPQVMGFVGFPRGLGWSEARIREQIVAQAGDGIFGRMLVVILKASGAVIGECKMYLPNADGIASTDVKLLPTFWGHKYGVEVKRALVDYLFAHTDCVAVEGTPNKDNIASIKMQEAVGGVRVGERAFIPDDAQRDFMTAVHSYVYHVYRPE